MNSHRFGLFAAGLMLLVTTLTGCGPSGPPLAPASGTVTLNGKPVDGANVTFANVADPLAVASGVTDAQGKFTLQTDGKPGAPLGKNNVGITKGKAAMATMSLEDAKKATMKTVDPSKMQNAKADSESELPSKYATPSSSGLSANVEAGKSNDFPFDLSGGAVGEKPAEKAADKPADKATEKPADAPK